MVNVKLDITQKQLEQLLDKGKLEIIERNKRKSYKAFHKVAISKLKDGQGQEQLDKVLKAINKNNKINMKNMEMLKNVQALNSLNVVLNGLNLCATCAGFAIMYIKLNKMSDQIKKVMEAVKDTQDVFSNYEFNKVLSEYNNMLDCRKKQKEYNEEEMRELIDSEYNVLKMLLDVTNKDVTEDMEAIVFAIIALSSMLANSIMYFDETYYYNNKESIKNGDVWHSNHDNWMAVYDVLCSNDFIEIIQDLGVFHFDLNTKECHAYCSSIIEQFEDAKQSIIDNQFIIKSLDNAELVKQFNEYNNKIVKDEIDETIKNLNINDPKVLKSIDQASQVVGIN